MINFSFHEVVKPTSFDLNDRWANTCATSLFKEVGQIDYVFCSDNYLLEINQKALNHDYYTDIITFDLREEQGLPLDAEIYISLDRVRENAERYSCTFAEEIRRVMIHGLLHLSGLNDSTEEEKSHMRQMENKYIDLF